MYAETSNTGINMIDMTHKQMLIVKDSLLRVLCEGNLELEDKKELSMLITELNRVYAESRSRIYSTNK